MKEIEKKFFKKGDYIFFEGDLESHFFIVEMGEVQIFTKNKTTGQIINLAQLKEGEIFGEFALIDSGSRTASAQALTDCELIQVSHSGYNKMLSELPLWASSMMKSFASRLKTMNNNLKK